MIIQFNSFQFAVNVESPNEDYNLLDNEKFISLKIKQVVRNNITNRNIKFLYYWFNIENNITEIKAVKWKYNMFPTINSSIVKLFINCRLMVWGLQPTIVQSQQTLRLKEVYLILIIHLSGKIKIIWFKIIYEKNIHLFSTNIFYILCHPLISI